MDLDRKIDLKEVAMWVVNPVAAFFARLRRPIKLPAVTKQARFFRESFTDLVANQPAPSYDPMQQVVQPTVTHTDFSGAYVRGPLAVSGMIYRTGFSYCAVTGRWIATGHIASTGDNTRSTGLLYR